MIKVRLCGSSEYVDKMIVDMKSKFTVTSCSSKYKNRNSTDVRVYMEIKL